MEALKKKLSAKLKQNGGFTLVEMLIVVAIIAILMMVSIPLISSNLEKAREATDTANERSAMSMAETYFLLNSTDTAKMEFTGTSDPKTCTLYYVINKETHQGEIVSDKDKTAGATVDANNFKYGLSKKKRTVITGSTEAAPEGNGIAITITKDGDIKTLTWQAP